MTAMLCLLAAGIAFSLTVENISLERMSRESHAIVFGSVLSSYSQWEEKNIYTYTTVRVKESLKGNNSSTITVKQLGGTVGEIGQEVSGSPRLVLGEDVVLFLTQWKGAFWIHSIVLGKFSIISENGRQVAFNDLNNIGLIDPVTKEEITQPNQKSNHIPLQNFLGEVRSFNTR
jgi:hypothetical protein